ncbi:uncharacterized protein TNCV_809271 [Trichonephila clavipes]|nr:uncharacterized protein TNCV_809271 [Trichonephila clavipes]
MSEAPCLSSPSINLTRGLAARRLFIIPPCREGTIQLQISMPSPEFEPRPYGTALEGSEDFGIAQSVISRLWQQFQDDGNVSTCYSTGRPRVTTPNEDRYIWQLLPKETDGAQHQTCLVSSLQLPVRQFQGKPCTDT